MNTQPHHQDEQNTHSQKRLEEMPGRVVDVIAAAARAHAVCVNGMVLSFGRDGDLRSVLVHVDPKTQATALRLFAALGVTGSVGEPYGSPGNRQADVIAPVPALGLRELAVIVLDVAPDGPSDPAALIAQVDARRAAAMGGEGAR